MLTVIGSTENDMPKNKDKLKLKHVTQLASDIAKAYEKSLVENVYNASRRSADSNLDLKRNIFYFPDDPKDFPIHNIKHDDMISALKNVGVPDNDYIIKDGMFYIVNDKSSLKITKEIDGGYPIVESYKLYYKNMHVADFVQTDSLENFTLNGTIFTLPVPDEAKLLKENWLTDSMIRQICKDFAAIPVIRFWGQSKNKDELELIDDLKKPFISVKLKQEKIDNFISSDKNKNRRLFNIINDVIHDSKYQHRYFHKENYFAKYGS